MQIHKLFNNIEEYKDYFWSFLKHNYSAHGSGEDVWKEEDRPLLKPFFDYDNETAGNNQRRMTKEESDSFDYYNKCREDYADEEFEKRDSVAQIDDYDLFKGFFLKYPSALGNDRDDDLEEINRDILKDIEFELIDDLKVEFPLILTGAIESSWDRMGDISFLFLDIVELKEFKS